jgi:ADP-heptose:LPS heptosyltransferase/GT2 family glycosyltransferase
MFRRFSSRKSEAARRLAEEIELLHNSPLVDPVWYRQTYAELRDTPIDVARHYLEHGAAEGRNPGPFFDTNFYLDQNPDVANSGMNPLVHYILYGVDERRNPSPHFNVNSNLSQNSEIASDRTNPIIDYLKRDFSEEHQSRTSSSDEVPDGAAHPQLRRVFATAEAIRYHIDKPLELRNGAVVAVRKGLLIEGWAIASSGVASIDISIGAKQFGSAHYGLPRWDVAERNPGWANAKNSGFMITVPSRLLEKGKHTVRISFRDELDNVRPVEFQIDVATHVDDDLALGKINQSEANFYERLLKNFQWRPVFYILIAVPRGTEGALKETLLSLRQQVYSDWMIGILAEPNAERSGQLPGDAEKKLAWRDRVLVDFREISDRIEFLEETSDAQIAKLPCASRSPALFGLLSAGDVVSNDALLQCAVKTGLERDGEFFYSDELRISPASNNLERFLKPQWSPDLALSTNYIGRFWVATRPLFERAGPVVSDLFHWGEYDLVLRLTEMAERICHIPELLCLRGAGGLDQEFSDEIALQRALDRRKIEATVRRGFADGVYRIQRELRERKLVSVIIPVGRKTELLKRTIFGLLNETGYDKIEIILVANPGTSPAALPYFQTLGDDSRIRVVRLDGQFNFSRLCNFGAQSACGEFLLFLNDDVQVIERKWLDALLEHAQRPEVGVVGPMLLWPDRTIQSAGVFLTNKVGVSAHAFRNAAETEPGYFGLAQTERNVIAINGACFMTRRDVFEKIGGFNEAHRVVNNETDYCLKAWREGYLLIYTPYSKLIHHERTSRTNEGEDYDAAAFREQWGSLFADGDPFHHPNLSKESVFFTPEAEPVRRIRAGYPLAKRESIKSILIVKLDHIGDCITAFPAMRRLKEAFPDATLTALVGSWTRPIWAMAEMIDDTIEFDFFHERADGGIREISESELGSLRDRLAPRAFDLAVDFRRHPETRHILEHIGARMLAGYDLGGRFSWLDVALEWGGDSARQPKRNHASDELIRLADAVIAACSPELTVIAPQASNEFSLPPDLQARLFSSPVVCVHPAAGDLLKQWPAEYFAELINMLVKRHGVNVVLVGGPKDKDISSAVLSGVDLQHAVFDLVGRLALSELPSLLLRCALFVGNDSGPKHVAGGLGIPTVGIHSGHVDAHEWGPAGPLAIALQREMECGPCYLPSPKLCPRNLSCLTGFVPGRVYDMCRILLAAGVASDPRAE